MIIPKVPANDKSRVKALHETQLLDTPIDSRFERITRLAKKIFNVPIVAISFLDSDRQWIKASCGIDVTETERETSFCGHTILNDEVMIIDDASKDQRFFDNPAVTGDMNVRFYAGCPIHASQNHKIGALCIVDNKPRQFNQEEKLMLEDLASLVDAEIRNLRLQEGHNALLEELDVEKRNALIDGLTRIWNRKGINQILDNKLKQAQEKNSLLGLIVVDIDHFKSVNDRYGHDIGDEVLKATAKSIVSSCRECDTAGRWGGEEFVVIVPGQNKADIIAVAERIGKDLAREPIVTKADNIPVTATLGLAFYDRGRHTDIGMLFKEADQALYQGKKTGRNKLIIVENEDITC